VSGTVTREGQTFAGESLAARYASFVKLPHTLFALPFAGTGAIVASYLYPGEVTVMAAVWIVLAFTAARFAAMGFNRIVDREFDAANPRTRARELPAGKLSVPQATAAVLVAGVVFIAAAFQLNPLCGWLSPLALGWTFFYSYTKRFTAAAHLVLGFSLSIAPVGAYLAIAGEWSEPWWALLVLSAGVTFWTAGFDTIYALQDIDFDRDTGLRSIPARLGVQKSLTVARLLHLGSVSCFLAIAAFRLFPVGWLYAAAVGVMGGLLLIEHRVVAKTQDVLTIDRAFFRLNVLVSTSFFALTLLDRLLLA